MLACVGVNYHWVKMTSGVFTLVIRHPSEQTAKKILLSTMATYEIFQNMISQTMFIYQ